MGTVYTPPEVMLPKAGVFHVTAVFDAPVTVGVKTADWPLVIEIQRGLMEILTSGIRVTVAVSVGCMELAAVTVTLLSAVMEAGAVYFPDVVTLPELGLIDQVYSVATPGVTENDSVWDGFSVIVAGVIDCACKATANVKSTVADRSPFPVRIGILRRLLSIGTS